MGATEEQMKESFCDEAVSIARKVNLAFAREKSSAGWAKQAESRMMAAEAVADVLRKREAELVAKCDDLESSLVEQREHVARVHAHADRLQAANKKLCEELKDEKASNQELADKLTVARNAETVLRKRNHDLADESRRLRDKAAGLEKEIMDRALVGDHRAGGRDDAESVLSFWRAMNDARAAVLTEAQRDWVEAFRLASADHPHQFDRWLCIYLLDKLAPPASPSPVAAWAKPLIEGP